MPAADPYRPDPLDRDPRDNELARRSATPAVVPWVMAGVLVLLGVGVYVILAVAA